MALVDLDFHLLWAPIGGSDRLEEITPRMHSQGT